MDCRRSRGAERIDRASSLAAPFLNHPQRPHGHRIPAADEILVSAPSCNPTKHSSYLIRYQVAIGGDRPNHDGRPTMPASWSAWTKEWPDAASRPEFAPHACWRAKMVAGIDAVVDRVMR